MYGGTSRIHCPASVPGPAALVVLASLFAGLSAASADRPSDGRSGDPIGSEPWNTGWEFYLDNDAFTLVNRDQQYTGGFALTLSGRRAVENPVSVDSALGWLNELVGFAALSKRGLYMTRHSIEFGATAFTPDEIERSAPIRDDHPYAGLVFLSNIRQTVQLDRRVSYQSSLSIGLLGTDIPKGIQNTFHEIHGDQKPQGWDHQIADGGEPTFLYFVSRQQPHWIADSNQGLNYDIRSTLGGSIGYTTQLVAGINWRWGRIRTPWWGSNPDFAEYIGLGTPVARSRAGGSGSGGTATASEELYLWGSLQVRQRFYNALLEGQFRDSEVTFDRSELDSTLGMASVGVTWGLRNGYRLTGAIQAREQEVEDTDGLDPVWGSIIVSRAF